MDRLVSSVALALAVVLVQACGGAGATQGDAQDRTPAGYGGRPQDEVTGAVSSVEPDRDTNRSYSTMLELLQGRFSGLQIFEGPSGDIVVRIRGVYAQSNPLLVVDGVPVPAYSFSTALRTLDPQDVRSVQVLKDAGSTSTYGNRGANGVILIRLKRR